MLSRRIFIYLCASAAACSLGEFWGSRVALLEEQARSFLGVAGGDFRKYVSKLDEAECRLNFLFFFKRCYSLNPSVDAFYEMLHSQEVIDYENGNVVKVQDYSISRTLFGMFIVISEQDK